MAARKKSTPEHIQLVEELEDLLLKEYKKRLEDGTISDTGMSNLQRLLQGWGWVVEDEVVNSLGNKLTKKIDPKKYDEDDEAGVVGRIA